jgi:hypothetical protein
MSCCTLQEWMYDELVYSPGVGDDELVYSAGMGDDELLYSAGVEVR